MIEPNKKGKAAVRKYFGFIKEEDSGIDYTGVGCRLSITTLKYSRNNYDEPDGPHVW